MDGEEVWVKKVTEDASIEKGGTFQSKKKGRWEVKGEVRKE